MISQEGIEGGAIYARNTGSIQLDNLVFSAGLREDRRLELITRGAARTLRKPVALAELLGTIAELLGIKSEVMSAGLIDAGSLSLFDRI